jgi:rubrerythrin
MTLTNLRSAYGGESMAHMRYIAWGKAAQKEGFPNVGRLFAAVSFAEEIHATKHFKAMAAVGGGATVTAAGGFGLADTSTNLAGAIEGETYEIEEMYPAFLAVAKFQDEARAVKSMERALAAERVHAEMYTRAKEAVDGGADMELGPVQICDHCGWTVEGEAPERCPLCNVGRDRFRTF